MTTFLPRDPDELLAHAAWVRRLARQLVGTADADDVAQDALLAAARAPHGIRSLGAWLGGVVQRLAVRRRRDAARRQTRERLAAQPEAVASTAELLTCVQQQREVAQLLTELEEPFRTVLLLRFFEELTPAAIALRLAVPAATVRTRLHRGVAMLRQRLQRRHGADWRASLAALAWLPAGRATPWTWWMVAMTTTQKMVAVFAALALLLGTMWWSLAGSPPPSANGMDASVAPAVVEAAAPTDAAQPGEPARAPGVQRVDATPEAAVPRAAPTATLRGRVFDSRGQPFADLPLQLCRYEPGDRPLGEVLAGAVTRSDALGTFELPAPADQNVVVVAGSGFVTLRTTPSFSSPDRAGLLVVVATAQAMRGFVHDEQGAPLAGVRALAWSFLLPEFPRPLERTVDPQGSRPPAATTGVDGRFALPAVAVGPGLSLSFTRDGYQHQRVATLDVQGGFVDVTMHKTEAGAGAVVGTVTDAGGRPVEAAQLRYGYGQKTTSAADGSFRFELEKRPLRLLALHPGFRPIVRDRVGADTPMPLRLQFTQPCLEIRGRVVDGKGAPLAGVPVNLADPERAGGYGSVERLSSSRPEQGLPEGARARTDADGAFTITGLSERSYRVRVWDEHTAQSVQSEPVPAGSSDVVLVLSAAAFAAELRGRVVTRDGQGVAGAMVSSHLIVGSLDGFAMVQGPRATTGADGRFALQQVPTRYLELCVLGEDFEYATAQVEDCLRQGEARLVVLRKCYVQVEGRAGPWVRFLDGDGKALTVSVDSLGVSQSGNGWRLSEAKSPVMTVAETAVTMAWLQDDKELGRKSIDLQPGKQHVNVLTIEP